MREHPLIMKGPLVRATLEGRKTQTRRPLRNQPPSGYHLVRVCGPWAEFENDAPTLAKYSTKSPLGETGDRLWVRETWTQLLAVSPQSDEPLPIGPGERLIEPPTQWTDRHGRRRWNYDGKVIAYRANSDIEFCDGDGHSSEFANRADMPRWRSSTCMPRWASRITLPLVSVRVERVQDITEEDAKAEGVEPVLMRGIGSYPEWMRPTMREGHQKAFELLWKQIYGDASWDANPWVWVAEWKEIEVSK